MTENQRLIGGRYQLGELIGRGGMADVYEGTDTRLGRVVAIKLLKSDLANDPSFENRFRQEAQSSARMTHPTIVRVYDAGEDQTLDNYGNPQRRPYIVMEFVRGTVLRDLMHNRRLTLEEAINYAEGVLTALEISHRAGIVHRDIKSANIMITETGQVKVMDFGIARIVSEGSATQAHTQGIVGTAQYFSPEQARGETVDFRSDLYSTGVLLYEMLAGQPPFRGETAVSVAYQHVSEAVTPPSKHNSMIPYLLDEVVMRSLAKSKDERYQSAAEFREHLLAAVGAARDEAVTTNSVPLQIIEDSPIDDFDSLLRGVSEGLPTAAETVVDVKDMLDLPPAYTVEKPAKFKRSKKVAREAAAAAADAAAASAAGISAINSSNLAAGEPTRVFDNPFAEIGVEFKTEPPAVRTTKRGREISQAAPSAKALAAVISAMLVIIIGLIVWLGNTGGFDFKINTAGLGIKVADVVGKTYTEAYEELSAQNLVVRKVYQASETVKAESVVSTDPPAGTVVNAKMVVIAYVSSGKAQITVPKLESKTEKQAKALLEKYGLVLGLITPAPSAKVEKGRVISSDPKSGTRVLDGSTVNLTVSNGKVIVPNVVDESVKNATRIMTAEDVGFTVNVTTKESCSGTLGKTVIEQSLEVGKPVPQGSSVILYVECQ